MRYFVAAGAVVVAMVCAAVFLPQVASLSHDARAEAVLAEAHACATAAGQTSCAIVLDHPHLHDTTVHLRVLETSPGSQDRTSATSVASDQQTLTISGLSPETAYQFAVDYEREHGALGPAGGLLGAFPLLFTIGMLLLGVVAGLIVTRAV